MLCNVLVHAPVAVRGREICESIQSCHRDPSWILLAPGVCQHDTDGIGVTVQCVCVHTIVNCWEEDNMLCRFIDGRWQLGR